MIIFSLINHIKLTIDHIICYIKMLIFEDECFFIGGAVLRTGFRNNWQNRGNSNNGTKIPITIAVYIRSTSHTPETHYDGTNCLQEVSIVDKLLL